MHSNTSPEFKGIKTLCWLPAGRRPDSNTSPEFKGIKTRIESPGHPAYYSNTSPEFKGIKTLNIWEARCRAIQIPALNSKGLRRSVPGLPACR